MTYIILKYLHVLGAIVLLGTGTGIAFFMLMAHRSGDVRHIFQTAKVVVLADFLFTATAVAAQPITGFLLAQEMNWSMSESWIAASLALYIVAGVFWLPVIWMQRRMRDLAGVSAANGQPLPAEYHRLFGLWLWFGIPGFGSVISIIWLMIAKPSLW